MNHASRLLARMLVSVVVLGPISACVSPATRVPCDGRLEPINLPVKKADASNKRLAPTTSKVSP
jgi:hypothetical protein